MRGSISNVFCRLFEMLQIIVQKWINPEKTEDCPTKTAEKETPDAARNRGCCGGPMFYEKKAYAAVFPVILQKKGGKHHIS